MGAGGFPTLLGLLQLVAEAHLSVPQQGGLFKILPSDGLLQGGDGLFAPLFQSGAVLRLLGPADLHAGGRLVHQVDGFVRQVPVGQVALGQGNGGVNGLVGDDQPVIGLVPGAQGGQDGLGHRWGGRFQLHRLEPAFQGGVLADEFPVFLLGGGTQHLNLAPAQRRFQDVGRVDGAFRTAGADDGVQFVQKEDDATHPLDFLQDALHPILELAPVLGACHGGG